MTLTLQIENYEVLEDGGPVQFTTNQGGFQAGRGPGMDWVLPDPSRHISGHHFEISYADGAYWLTDVSTNGTFLQGQRYRLDGPHKLVNGERFQVGHYIIAVHLGVAPPAPAPAPAPQMSAAYEDNDNPWDIGGLAATPIDPLPRPNTHLREDFADDFIANPMPVTPSPPPAPQPSSPQEPQPAAMPVPPVSAPMPPPVPQPQIPPQETAPAPQAFAPQPVAPPPASPAPADDKGPVTAADVDFFKAFCEGAGLSHDAYSDVNPDELARELGKSLRRTTEEIMLLLKNRASAKQFTKGTERTMRQATDNNPLKFLPDADQALEAMFLKHRAGFLKGAEGLEEALKDIRLHQAAVFAAIQPALTRLLKDLEPEEILDTAGSGILKRGARSKAWETYVERWDAKTHPHENGILDEFLSHFAQAYSDMTKKGYD